MAYHVFGRDDSVYPQGQKIQIGMDYILSILLPNEHLLRVVAMSATALAAMLFAILVLQLGFNFNNVTSVRRRAIIGCLFPSFRNSSILDWILLRFVTLIQETTEKGGVILILWGFLVYGNFLLRDLSAIQLRSFQQNSKG